MASYLIKRNPKSGEIIVWSYDLEGYKMNPNFNNARTLKINQVTILKPSMIEHVLAIKFNRTFRKLAQAVLQLIEDEDAASDDTDIALGEIDRMKDILLNKYHKFLSRKLEKEFLAKLYYLEKELKYKQLLINQKLTLKEDKIKARSK